MNNHLAKACAEQITDELFDRITALDALQSHARSNARDEIMQTITRIIGEWFDITEKEDE
jgi:hypothetical protein